MKRIIFTVTNDLTYDQRMQRICTSLAANGFNVLLVGRKLKNSLPAVLQLFQQKRIRCFCNTGFLFYAEYNFRLFWYLLFQRADILCAIDLDTILTCYAVSVFRNKKRVYDAHELFTEQKEIITRKRIHIFWLAVEKFSVPKFTQGYTVNDFIANELKRRYSVQYEVIRNLPVLTPFAESLRTRDKKFIIYQGAVNEGRSFETLIPVMKNIDAKLIICGKGNFFQQVQQLIAENNLQDKIELKGYMPPDKLKDLTPDAQIAVMLFEATGLNQYQSLSNRFFDYIMACVPQVCVNFPEYKIINDKFNIAFMIDDTKEETITAALNKLLQDGGLHEMLRRNCITAREELNWQKEELKLIYFYKRIVNVT